MFSAPGIPTNLEKKNKMVLLSVLRKLETSKKILGFHQAVRPIWPKPINLKTLIEP